MNDFTVEQLKNNAVTCGLPQEFIEALVRYFPDIASLLPEYMERYYQAWPDKPDGFDTLFEPEIRSLGPERTQALYITMILAGVPRSEQLYRDRGYPPEMWREIMTDLRLHVELAAPGFLRHRSSIWWSYEIISGYTIQFGRLQFQQAKFYGRVRGYRHNVTGRLTLLALGGDCFGPDGLYTQESGPHKTCFMETEGHIAANPIHDGRIQQELVNLALQDHHLYLDSNSDVMVMHIPEGKKLDQAQCRESFKRAAMFSRQYFPHIRLKGFICLSWLLDVQLQKILSSDSNIMKFQRSGYLYPLKTFHSEAVKRVFGTENLDDVTPKTCLQKGIAQLIADGVKLRSGAIFIPLDNIMEKN